MKEQYTRTLTIENLENAEVTLYVFEGNKYLANLDEAIKEVSYKGIKGWDVIRGGKEAEEIETETDADGIDEDHEYLVLHLLNGETATFRNSHVDMFIH